MSRMVEGVGLEIDEAIPEVEVAENLDQNYMERFVHCLVAQEKKVNPEFSVNRRTVDLLIPYMRFTMGLDVDVRHVSKDEYLDMLAVTSPRLHSSIAGTDIGSRLPEKIRLTDRSNDVFPLPLGWVYQLKEEELVETASKIKNASEQGLLIPDSYFFSMLFTGNFSEYLAITNQDMGCPAYFLTKGEWVKQIPRTEQIFSSDNILTYMQAGFDEVLPLIDEYEYFRQLCYGQGSDSFPLAIATRWEEKIPELFYGETD